MGLRIRTERGMRAGVPVFGSDCRVALRAPRNDKSSPQCTVHSCGRGHLRAGLSSVW
ncbi:MAG: hypothetical protein LBL66_00735 [Clostridiales bacterium]|nr:hypothetical protein [Clostridiales bacterium]